MSTESFSKCLRLVTKNDFSNLRKGSRFFVSDVLIFYVKKNDLPNARIGLAVSKKFGNAVKRNKVKRLLREFFRKNHLRYNELDILVSLNMRVISKQKIEFKDVVARVNPAMKTAFNSDFKR